MAGLRLGLLDNAKPNAAHFALARGASAASPSALGARVVSQRFGLDGEATWAAGARPAPAITGLHDQTGRPHSLVVGRPITGLLASGGA